MAHDLIVGYGLDKKMEVIVGDTHPDEIYYDSYPCANQSLLSISLPILTTSDWTFHMYQRAKRSTPFEMTRFHTDEYIDFLQRVSPETADDLTGKGTRCAYLAHSFVPQQIPSELETCTLHSLDRRGLSCFRWSIRVLLDKCRWKHGCCKTDKLRTHRSSCQLGWWSASCQEERSFRFLLR